MASVCRLPGYRLPSNNYDVVLPKSSLNESCYSIIIDEICTSRYKVIGLLCRLALLTARPLLPVKVSGILSCLVLLNDAYKTKSNDKAFSYPVNESACLPHTTNDAQHVVHEKLSATSVVSLGISSQIPLSSNLAHCTISGYEKGGTPLYLSFGIDYRKRSLGCQTKDRWFCLKILTIFVGCPLRPFNNRQAAVYCFSIHFAMHPENPKPAE